MGMSLVMDMIMIVVMMVTRPVMVLMRVLHPFMGMRMMVAFLPWFEYGWFFSRLSAAAAITHGIPD
jgi:hypothetical protein